MNREQFHVVELLLQVFFNVYRFTSAVDTTIISYYHYLAKVPK